MYAASLRKIKKYKQFDSMDLIIVEALGKYGPRNILKIANYLGLAESTLRYRINNMIKRKLLKLHTNVYHTSLGLKKVLIFADIDKMYSTLIEKFMTINDFWAFISRIHGLKEGIHALYTVPIRYVNKLNEYLEALASHNIIRTYEIYYSTCFHRVNPTMTWFDLKINDWRFDWQGLIKEIEISSTYLPYTLRDPADFPILADEMDVFILKELEKNAIVSFREIAKKTGTTPQNIYYHYHHHIVANRLIEDFQIYLRKYDPMCSVLPYFIIDFHDKDIFAKVANSLRNKPFVEVLGKILGRNTLFISANLPLNEFVNMLNTLNEMVALGYINEYRYYLSYPLEGGRRQTIPYKNFVNGSWMYHHDEYMRELEDLYKKVKTELKS
jgi:DNA-binding Lrp family transcriptional regulator